MLNLTANTQNAIISVAGSLSEQADTLRFKKGQYIYCEHSTPLGAYFIQDGKVKITHKGSSGKEKVLRIDTANDILGYADMLDNRTYSSSAVALEDTTLYFIPKGDFMAHLKEHRLLHEQLLIKLSKDLLSAQSLIPKMAYKPVRGRLADALMELSDKLKEKDGQLPCIYISRADLAGYVGTAKETVNRLLSEFKKEKLITTKGKCICLLNYDRLSWVSNIYN